MWLLEKFISVHIDYIYIRIAYNSMSFSFMISQILFYLLGNEFPRMGFQ